MRDGVLDGIFSVGPDGAPAALMVSEGAAVMISQGTAPPLDQHIRAFGDDVSLNNFGEVVFFAGPLSNDTDTLGSFEENPGIVRYAGGILTPVAFTGQLLGQNRVSAFRLGPADGSVVVPPVVSDNGRVVFLASLDGGSREAIAMWNPSGSDPQLLYTGGVGPSGTPAGGVYAGASSAPAIDAAGSLVFRARIAGGTTSEALVYRPLAGPETATVVGDATPGSGFFAGKPFSAPVINDQGDVVFRAFVARGPASVGIFRLRDGVLQAVVRSGDPAPDAHGEPFLDLLGQPSVNQSGAIAFVGQLASTGLGIYLYDDAGLHRVVASNDPAPGDPGAQFKTVALEPSLNDAGLIAFRATTTRFDPLTNERIANEGIFLADADGIRRVVATRDAAPSGDPFFRLRDPALTNVPSIAFRASLGSDKETATGVYEADATGIHQLALEKEALGAGITLARVTGDPIIGGTDALAFIGTRSRQVSDEVKKALGPSILRRTDNGLALVIAQDMPGPAGGTFRNLSVPAVNDRGHIAFRGSFLPFTGGVAGIFLAADGELEPYLTVGEATPAGGRFNSFGNRIALNARDDMAFTATTSGTSRAGIFVASRSRVDVKPIAVRIANSGRGRVKFNLRLRLGRTSDGVIPGTDPVTVTVSDARGTLWTATVSGGTFKRRGNQYVATPRKRSKLGRKLEQMRLSLTRDGTPIVSGASKRVDLIPGGTRPLTAPVAVTLQIGDDAGVRPLACLPGAHAFTCRSD